MKFHNSLLFVLLPRLRFLDAVVLDMLYGEKPEHLEQFVRSSQLNTQFRQEVMRTGGHAELMKVN
jgi:hypothetical protein